MRIALVLLIAACGSGPQFEHRAAPALPPATEQRLDASALRVHVPAVTAWEMNDERVQLGGGDAIGAIRSRSGRCAAATSTPRPASIRRSSARTSTRRSANCASAQRRRVQRRSRTCAVSCEPGERCGARATRSATTCHRRRRRDGSWRARARAEARAVGAPRRVGTVRRPRTHLLRRAARATRT